MSRCLAPALLTIAFSLVGPSLARATVAAPLSFSELAREAEVVVHAEVLMSESLWDVDKRNIYTHTRVRVLRWLKGAGSEKEILVRQLGGAVGGLVMTLPGNASLRVGEEVVLFLTRDSLHHFVVGLSQGKFSVAVDASGRKVLSRDLSGIAFARRDRTGRMVIGTRFELEMPLTLDELEARIQKASSR
jgi:hypothetical protein